MGLVIAGFFRKVLYPLLVGAIVLTSCTTAPPVRGTLNAPLRVYLSDGWYEGTYGSHVRKFLGIRYAQAPTGSLRFSMPMPMGEHQGTWGAKSASTSCPQPHNDAGNHPQDEDCLTVNVTTPRGQTIGQNLPIMVWFHGGGFTVGDGHQYNPDRLVDEGKVIVVTANFRLGVLAQLGLPGLTGSGDFGLADQLSVLQWIHRNATALGGDPTNVTVFGESSGAMSICALLTSPHTQGLLAKAILSSGSCATAWPAGVLHQQSAATRPYAPVAQAVQRGSELVGKVGCEGNDPIDCLRHLPLPVLLAHASEFGDVLAYGTPLLPWDPSEAMRDNNWAAVPLISGFNHDEAAQSVAASWKNAPINHDRLQKLVENAFGGSSSSILHHYSVPATVSLGETWARIATDASWICPALILDSHLARRSSVFSYEFDEGAAPARAEDGQPQVRSAATHGSELYYLFDVSLVPHINLTPQQKELSHRMIQYWTSFAWTSYPQGEIPWPPLATGRQGPVLRISSHNEENSERKSTWEEHQCSLWNAVLSVR